MAVGVTRVMIRLAHNQPIFTRFPPQFRVPLSGRLNRSSVRLHRTLTTKTTPILARPTLRQAGLRLALSGLAIGGTVALTGVFLNRETRDSLSTYEREFLQESFQYTAAGLTITAIGARLLFKSGFAVRMMSTNPWLVLGLGVASSVTSVLVVVKTAPENTILRHTFWLAFNASQAAFLSPLFFFAPVILSRAALYTFGVVGSLSYVGATAKTDKFLYLGAPLLAGVTVVVLSGLAPMALPLGMRSLAITEGLWLYGGLIVYGGRVLYDTQNILYRARMAQTGTIKRDTLRGSIALQYDVVNIFIRLTELLPIKRLTEILPIKRRRFRRRRKF